MPISYAAAKLCDVSTLAKRIRFIETLIERSLLLIFIGAPLAFGSVYSLVYGGIQMLALFILLLYWVHQCLVRFYFKNRAASGEQNINTEQWFLTYRFHTFLSRYPFVIPFLLWVGLVVVQMIPLAPEVLSHLPQKTFELYATVFGMDHFEWQTLSLSSFDSWRALTQVVACSILFYLVVTYTPVSFWLEPHPHNEIWNALVKKVPSGDSFSNRLLLAATLAVGFEAVYALIEYMTGNQHLYFFRRSAMQSGAAGTFVNRNHLANYLVLFLPLFFSWFIFLLRSPNQSEYQVHSFRGQKTLFAVILIAMVLAVVASHSRMAMFSGILAVVLLGLTYLFLEPSKKAIGLLLVLLITAVFFLIYLDPGFSLFQSRLSFFVEGRETVSRFQVWRDSIEIVRDFPWIGTGLETFQFIFPKYSSVPITSHFTYAHSDWLQLLVETGVLGLLFIVVTIFWFLMIYVWRIRLLHPAIRPVGIGILISLIAFMIHSSAEFNFHIPANAYSFAILAGMAVRLVDREGKAIR